MSKLLITWSKSAIGYPEPQKQTIRALGLRKLNHSVEQEDCAVIRGMVRKVSHLVEVKEVSAE